MVRLDQIATLGIEVILLAMLLIGLFRQRARLGLSPLVAVLGALQFLQTALALSIYVEIAPGVLVSPGSVVLFPASLFAVLLVYVRADANDARKLIYGLLAANVSLVGLSALFGIHFLSDQTRNFVDLPAELFAQNPRLVLVGTAALYLDVILVILAYEWLSRVAARFLAVRTIGALGAVLAFDAVFFATGGFVEKPEYTSILVSGLVGKLLAAGMYGGLLAVYLRHFEGREFLLARRDGEVRDIFEVLTFRQSYEALREHAVRDSLTGLYNRSFFTDVLPGEIERAQRFGRPMSLLRLDLDDMRAYNAAHGYEQGDRLLVAVGAALTEVVRVSDVTCRYESDGFAVLLSDAERGVAQATAERFRARLAEFMRSADPPLPGKISVTVGIACYPEDTATDENLVAVAERRMRAGQSQGGDRVVAA